MEKLGSFKYTRDTLAELSSEARAEMNKFGPNKLMEKLFDDLSTWSDPNDVKKILGGNDFNEVFDF